MIGPMIHTACGSSSWALLALGAGRAAAAQERGAGTDLDCSVGHDAEQATISLRREPDGIRSYTWRLDRSSYHRVLNIQVMLTLVL